MYFILSAVYVPIEMLGPLELGPLVHYIGQNGSICLRSKLTGSQRNINFGITIVFWTIFATVVRKRSYIFLERHCTSGSIPKNCTPITVIPRDGFSIPSSHS